MYDDEWEPRSERRDTRLLALYFLLFGLVLGGAGAARTTGWPRWVFAASTVVNVFMAGYWWVRSSRE